MNYRHAFHAGNHADVLKHVVLIAILDALARKETPFAVLDTHAGRGLYDLESEEAGRGGEAANGIARLRGLADAPAALAAYLDAVRACAPAYPGSPVLIARRLRAGDRLAACELHPEEATALKRAMRGFANAHIHARDGYEALGALLPFPERRGLVLIDPPFEALDEFERVNQAVKRAQARMRQAVFMIWRPLKDLARVDAADAELSGEKLRADLAVAAPQPAGKLTASSVLVINPPFGLEAALAPALETLAARLALDESAFWTLRPLV